MKNQNNKVIAEYNSSTVTNLAKEKINQSEGNECTRQDILAYIDEQIGLNNVTEGQIARGVANVLKDDNYVKSGYARYKRVKDIKEKQDQPYLNLIDNTNKILKETLIKLQKEINNYESYTKSNLNYSSENIIEEIRIITENLRYTKKFSDFINENIDLDIN